MLCRLIRFGWLRSLFPRRIFQNLPDSFFDILSDFALNLLAKSSFNFLFHATHGSLKFLPFSFLHLRLCVGQQSFQSHIQGYYVEYEELQEKTNFG